MPVVLNPQVVSVNDIEGYRALGEGSGALLAALIDFYRRRTPGPHQLATPQYPEQLRFPSGVTTSTSPQELAAIQAAGGVPTRTGAIVPMRTGLGTLLPRQGVVYQPPPPVDMERLIQFSKFQNLPLEKEQLETELQLKKQQARRAGAEASLLEQGGVPVYTVDPTTGQMAVVGLVSPKAKVVSAATPLEKITARQSAKTALRSINEIRGLLDPDYGGEPKLLLSAGLPGIQGSRELAKAFSRVKLEIVTARGGKQLTPSEQVLVRSTFPNTIDALDALLRKDPTVIQQALDEMELVSQGIIQELDPDVIQQQLKELRSGQAVRPTQQTTQNAQTLIDRYRTTLPR